MISFDWLADLAENPSAMVSVQEDRCLRRRLNSCECTECIQVCPTGALSIRDRRIQLSASVCTGCMICTTVCPNDALNAPGLDPRPLLAYPTGQTLYLSCRRQGQLHPNECTIPCLGGLSIELVLALGLKRSAPVLINSAGCRTCENMAIAKQAIAMLCNVRRRAGTLFPAGFEILSGPEQIEVSKIEGRRTFLSGITQNLTSAVVAQIPAISSPDRESVKQNKRRVPVRVSLVRDILRQAEDELEKLVTDLSVFDLEVDEQCTCCPLCKGICPSGAISITKSGKTKQLQVENSLCSGCGLCVSFCRQKALTLHQPPFRQVIKDLVGTSMDPYSEESSGLGMAQTGHNPDTLQLIGD